MGHPVHSWHAKKVIEQWSRAVQTSAMRRESREGSLISINASRQSVTHSTDHVVQQERERLLTAGLSGLSSAPTGFDTESITSLQTSPSTLFVSVWGYCRLGVILNGEGKREQQYVISCKRERVKPMYMMQRYSKFQLMNVSQYRDRLKSMH